MITVVQKYAHILLGVFFITFIIFPTEIPFNVARFLDSTLGIVSIFAIFIVLFCYTNPIVALLFVVAAILLLCKCWKMTRNEHHIQFTPTRKIVDSHMISPKTSTLEEQIVSTMAPLDNKKPTEFIDSSFKPMYNNMNSASQF